MVYLKKMSCDHFVHTYRKNLRLKRTSEKKLGKFKTKILKFSIQNAFLHFNDVKILLFN